MHFINYYQKYIINYDLINKINYKNIKTIPKLKKICLTFTQKNNDFKNLSSALLALNIITKKKSFFIYLKNPSVVLKLRKGIPIGCKVTLKKKKMLIFLNKLILEILPESKSIIVPSINNYISNPVFSFFLNNIINIYDLKEHYNLFKNLPSLHITVLIDSKSYIEFLFIIFSYKIIKPI
jgi:large subunit ribosomal protein L5